MANYPQRINISGHEAQQMHQFMQTQTGGRAHKPRPKWQDCPVCQVSMRRSGIYVDGKPV